jgi:integrase/recombinase XerD
MQLEDIIEEYFYHCMAKGFTKKTMINKKQYLNELKRFLIEKRAITELESVSVHDLKAYIRGKQQTLQAQSVVSMHKVIAAFFNWCVKEEYLKENIMKKVECPRLPKKVLKTFTPNEITALIDSFSFKNYLEVRNKAMLAMMADVGLRSMEVINLPSINVKETSILVNGKGNKERIVFISPALKKILIKYDRLKRQYFKDKTIKEDNYFLSYKGSKLSHVGLYNVVKEAGNRVGIEGKRVYPHNFRHFYACQTLLSGKLDIYSLSRLLGHSEVKTTQIYLSSLMDEQLLEKAVSSSPLMNI